MKYATLSLSFFVMVLVLLFNPSRAWGQPNILESDHVKEFGNTEGTNISSGFLFVDGRYVPPPYKVTRRGLSVFINDLRVDGPIIKWPVPEDWKEKPFTPPLDRDSVLKGAESSRRCREGQLENDFCIMLFSDLDKLVFRPDVTIAVIRVLQSERLPEEKINALEQMELGYDRTRGQLKALVDGFTSSPELTKRLGALVESPSTFSFEQERRARRRNGQQTNAVYRR